MMPLVRIHHLETILPYQSPPCRASPPGRSRGLGLRLQAERHRNHTDSRVRPPAPRLLERMRWSRNGSSSSKQRRRRARRCGHSVLPDRPRRRSRMRVSTTRGLSRCRLRRRGLSGRGDRILLDRCLRSPVSCRTVRQGLRPLRHRRSRPDDRRLLEAQLRETTRRPRRSARLTHPCPTRHFPFRCNPFSSLTARLRRPLLDPSSRARCREPPTSWPPAITGPVARSPLRTCRRRQATASTTPRRRRRR